MNRVAKKIQTVSTFFLTVSLAWEVIVLLMAGSRGGGSVNFQVNGVVQSNGDGIGALVAMILPTIVIFMVYYAMRGLAELIILSEKQIKVLEDNNNLLGEGLGKSKKEQQLKEELKEEVNKDV